MHERARSVNRFGRLVLPQWGMVAQLEAGRAHTAGTADATPIRMHTIPLARVGTLALAVLLACEPEPLPPDDTPDAGPQKGADLAEAPPPAPSTQGQESGLTAPLERTGPHEFQVPEPGDNPPAPPLGDPARARAELAATERELSAILDPLVDDIQARGVTREQLEQAQGDIRAERMLLGLSLLEYHELQRRLDGLLERARPLLAARPLTRDGRGGDDLICTTTTTVDEWGDGTIVITDHESCWPWSPDDDGGRSGDDPPDGPGGGGGGGPAISDFEIACDHANGTVVDGKCSCDQSALCRYTAIGTSPMIFFCKTPFSCLPTIVGFALSIYACREVRCDKVNQDYGK